MTIASVRELFGPIRIRHRAVTAVAPARRARLVVAVLAGIAGGHFAYVNASAQINRYIGVFGAYRFHDDAAAGDREPIPGQTFISSYPYRYQSPEVKVSVRLADWVDWNVGYQYYKFEERFREPVVVGPAPVEPASRQDYSAHLPYTSLRFYFGRR